MKQYEIDAAIRDVHARSAGRLGDGVYMTTLTSKITEGGHYYVDDDMSVVHGFVWFPLGNSQAKRCEEQKRFAKQESCSKEFAEHEGEPLVGGKEYSSRPAHIVTNGPGTILRIISDSD